MRRFVAVSVGALVTLVAASMALGCCASGPGVATRAAAAVHVMGEAPVECVVISDSLFELEEGVGPWDWCVKQLGGAAFRVASPVVGRPSARLLFDLIHQDRLRDAWPGVESGAGEKSVVVLCAMPFAVGEHDFFVVKGTDVVGDTLTVRLERYHVLGSSLPMGACLGVAAVAVPQSDAASVRRICFRFGASWGVPTPRTTGARGEERTHEYSRLSAGEWQFEAVDFEVLVPKVRGNGFAEPLETRLVK